MRRHRHLQLTLSVVRTYAAPVCMLAIVLTLSACGSSTTTTTNAAGQTVVTCHIRLAKTKFALHAGLALGAFHRYILKPYHAGAFKTGAPGRKKALLKAGASGLFAYHELKVADRDARCDGPVLRKLASPLASALSALASLRTALTAGNIGGIAGAAALLDKVSSRASQNGVPVKDINR
jgi:hypothetical protein